MLSLNRREFFSRPRGSPSCWILLKKKQQQKKKESLWAAREVKVLRTGQNAQQSRRAQFPCLFTSLLLLLFMLPINLFMCRMIVLTLPLHHEPHAERYFVKIPFCIALLHPLVPVPFLSFVSFYIHYFGFYIPRFFLSASLFFLVPPPLLLPWDLKVMVSHL